MTDRDNASADSNFTDSISKIYDAYLVPLIFEPYAADIANRVVTRIVSKPSARILEIAAGTGAVTRALARTLPGTAEIVATDLNASMLAQARDVGTARPVEWRHADAEHLPFDDNSFDVVVCQFGVMFFPDRPRAYSEIRRVLKPGGTFLFNVWGHVRENEFAETVTMALGSLFQADPPLMMVRTPHGYHDRETITRDLERGGFTNVVEFVTLSLQSRARSPRDVAIAYCQGTPMRNEILQRAGTRLEEATHAATAALQDRFGNGAIEGKIQAHVITVAK